MRQVLAPTGTLRVGVYAGSPTSLVKATDGRPAGVAHDLGQALARDLGVPVQVVEFARLAQVLEALKAGQVDFTSPLVRLELGYLVPAGSRLLRIDEVDRPGVRVGVAQGSTSQT
ncbi:MAG: ABC transporter substrate-binding protein, partial [Betaproteobacteria bacterium]|nr:ABC transporter substrate-binding protein [Betaproteobacteria bacterium]